MMQEYAPKTTFEISHVNHIRLLNKCWYHVYKGHTYINKYTYIYLYPG